jgi:hypothetical protein
LVAVHNYVPNIFAAINCLVFFKFFLLLAVLTMFDKSEQEESRDLPFMHKAAANY